MEYLLSIIIPMFNMEEYIGNLIEKLIFECENNVEIIVVDDGSDDNSYRIVYEIAKRDSRIKLFHQRNSGVSVARNLGLEMAKGYYITFLDADDNLDMTVLRNNQNLLDKKKECIIFGYKKEKDGKTEFITYDNFKGNTIEDLTKYAIETGALNTSWSKVYLRKIIKENRIQFPVGIKVGEDQIFFLRFIQSINNYKICSDTFYQYIVRPGSAMTRINKERFSDLEAVYIEQKKTGLEKEAAYSAFTTFCSLMAQAAHQYSVRELMEYKESMSNDFFESVFVQETILLSRFQKIEYILLKYKKDYLASLLFKLRSVVVGLIK